MNFAENHLTTGRLAESRDRLAALIAPADPAQRPQPGTESALRLLEIAALSGLADPQSRALPERLAALRTLVAAQPADFQVGWSFTGTAHYIQIDSTFTADRAALLRLIKAVGEGVTRCSRPSMMPVACCWPDRPPLGRHRSLRLRFVGLASADRLDAVFEGTHQSVVFAQGNNLRPVATVIVPEAVTARPGTSRYRPMTASCLPTARPRRGPRSHHHGLAGRSV
jgi:hypothetical protein